MTIETLDYASISQLSRTDVAYAGSDPLLRPFYQYPVELKGFEQVFADKAKDDCDRALLVQTLQEQYSAFDDFPKVRKNINSLLQDNCFTVITAHQPNLLLGPLYFVYKIMGVIRLSKVLNDKYPSRKVVPMFVIGGEDHDFEEVNHIQLFNKKLVWENNEKGSVGMMNTSSLVSVLDELQKILGESENAKEIFELISKNYRGFSEYHTATQGLLNDIFGRFGLVVINMNSVALKRRFIPHMVREITEQTSHQLVTTTQDRLQALGFKPQAFPREINLFYLQPQLRERIVFDGEFYTVLNTDIRFTSSEILSEINKHPEYFSPNVVMRPMYQEFIIPNLAYIGGGGELAYWLERKTQFESFGINFPMLIRRNSILWIDEAGVQKMAKLELEANELFMEVELLIKNYVVKHSAVTIDLSSEKVVLEQTYNSVEKLAVSIDSTLEKVVAAEKVKLLQGLEILEAKMIKAEKNKQDTAIQQIRTLVQKYCPNGGLQERTDNFLPYYIKYGPDFFDQLLQICDPLKKGFIVVKA
ncbi:MAG: bacillithiol biosynthesis cysteine-adding enzyme BshC [Saprospiraceae bacterium]